jgi:hypothetical protein
MSNVIVVPAPPATALPHDDSGPHDSGWCVRLEWPDGSHSMAGWSRAQAKALRRAEKMGQFWAAGPTRPRRIMVVQISRHDWRLHARRDFCRAPDCPGHVG